MEKNDRLAERNRGFFRAKKLLVLNVVSSPGSGKTTFIRETAAKLAGKLRVGVIVGDLATDNDAARLRTAGIPVVQITTGTVCHLDADMVSKAAAQMDLDQLDVLVIENVGNLVCPADYDLGEDLRVVLLSVDRGRGQAAEISADVSFGQRRRRDEERFGGGRRFQPRAGAGQLETRQPSRAHFRAVGQDGRRHEGVAGFSGATTGG